MLNERYKNNTKLYNHQILLRIPKLFIHSRSISSAHYMLRVDSLNNNKLVGNILDRPDTPKSLNYPHPATLS